MLQVSTRIDAAERAQLASQAARLLGVPVQSLTVHSWDELFPNSGGPSRVPGRIVCHAFTGFEVLGFESRQSDRKIKCCVFSYALDRCIWDEWSGTPDDHTWSQTGLSVSPAPDPAPTHS